MVSSPSRTRHCGEKSGQVASTSTGNVSDSMGDSVKDAKTKKEPSSDTIMPNAEGNNQTHEIASGAELNLVIHAAASTSGPIKK